MNAFRIQPSFLLIPLSLAAGCAAEDASDSQLAHQNLAGTDSSTVAQTDSERRQPVRVLELFDFERGTTPWQAFGLGNPSVRWTQPLFGTILGRTSLGYHNTAMSTFGGLWMPFTTDLSGYDEFGFLVRAHRSIPGRVALGFKDQDGEVWRQRTPTAIAGTHDTNVLSEMRVKVSLARENFIITDRGPGGGNLKPDLGALAELQFVFFDDEPGVPNEVLYTLDRIYARDNDAEVRSSNEDMLIDFEDGHDAWFAFGAGTPEAAPVASGMGEGKLALGYANSHKMLFGGLVREFTHDLSGYSEISYLVSRTGESMSGEVMLELKEESGDVWAQTVRTSIRTEAQKVNVALDRSGLTLIDRVPGQSNFALDLDQISEIHFIFFDIHPSAPDRVHYIIDDVVGTKTKADEREEVELASFDFGASSWRYAGEGRPSISSAWNAAAYKGNGALRYTDGDRWGEVILWSSSRITDYSDVEKVAFYARAARGSSRISLRLREGGGREFRHVLQLPVGDTYERLEFEIDPRHFRQVLSDSDSTINLSNITHIMFAVDDDDLEAEAQVVDMYIDELTAVRRIGE